ncbi:MAG: Structural protein [Candidatus Woesebacteria bacterium GW2011_GWB1_41_10]|uniref:Structural protein n=1 Tax=Candidatus Woesebacteria bacterium GW2011_GWB1_41_10 TaxID=1618577 RepID=A0A0G0UJH6_9BACT|nr:MAG: Structural protein [Candidatus Woesebacteria bacterium GW2011_GWB1_41_10]
MAKLVDPDSLNQGTEVVISTGAKTIQLAVAGNLSDTSPGSTSGVTLQAVYSFLKEEWKTDTALNKFKFPIKMFTKTDGTLQNGWAWADAQTRQLIRDGGWTEVDGDLYAGIISLGNFDSSSDQAYYQQVSGFNASTTNFDKTGNLNETIQIKDAGVTDYTGYLKVFLRIASGSGTGKLYSSYNLLSEQGLSALEPVLYRLPLSNSTDLKIDTSDTTIDSATSPWQDLKIVYLKGAGFTAAAAATYSVGDVVKDGTGRWAFCTGAGTVTTPNNGHTTFGGTSTWQAYDGEQQIGTNYYAFNRVVYLTSGTATAKQIYNWAQRQLRKTSDINTGTTTNNATQGGFGTVKGNVAVDLLEYVGDTLKTKPGVLIRNFDINDRNSMVFRDITVDGGGLNSESVPLTSTERTYPFVSAGTITFSSNLVLETDSNTKYAMYFTYITITTGTNIGISGASGSTCNLGWTGTTLDHLVNGDYIKISGFASTNNNGVYLVGAVDTGANTAALTKQDSNNPANESAGASVTVEENPFDTAGAIIVDDNSATDIAGQITASSINFDFDYTNNAQGGRTGSTNAPVTVVAQGLPLAEWVSVTSIITQATGISITVTANDERNYSNP